MSFFASHNFSKRELKGHYHSMLVFKNTGNFPAYKVKGEGTTAASGREFCCFEIPLWKISGQRWRIIVHGLARSSLIYFLSLYEWSL